jgi:hypothetical protein
MTKNIFERLQQRRPPIEKATKQPQKIQHAQKLLDWLQRWGKPTVCIRDVRIYGPRPHNREGVIGSAEILVENGWLSPIQSPRYDGRAWRINRKPIVSPKVVDK